MSPFVSTAKEKILTPRSLFFIFFVTLCYLSLTAFIPNYRLIFSTVTNNSSLLYKVTLITDLLTGIFSAISPLDIVFLLLNGLFVGLNIVLIIKTLKTLEGMGKIKLSVGGATLIGLVTAGCGACGFTIFSLLGISASFSFLPFHGIEIHVLSLIILLFSSWYMIQKLTKAKICQLY